MNTTPHTIKHLRTFFISCCLLTFSALSHANQSIQVDISTPPSSDAVDRILVGLNGYDVTPFSVVSADSVTITLETPLTAGSHSIIVLAFMENGSMETLTDEIVDIEASPDAVSSQWQHNTTLSTSYRIAEKEKATFDGIDNSNSIGATSVSNTTTTENWQIQSSAEIMYDNNSDNNPTGNEFELPYYNILASTETGIGTVSIAAGEQFIQQNNLLFSGYQRRGMTASLSNQHISVAGFNVHSDTTTAYDEDLLLPSGSDETTYGGTVTFSPLTISPERLQLSAGYVDGNGTTAGSGFVSFDDDTVFGGDSWNMAIDSNWLNNSMWLHLEHAESEFDSDGIDIGNDAETDDAQQAVLQFDSSGDLAVASLDSWLAAYQYQQVGEDFYSIANLYLPGNLTTHRLLLQGSKNGFQVNTEFSEAETNVDNDPSQVKQTSDNKSIDLYYTPFLINIDEGIWSYLGFPSFGAGYYHTDRSQPFSDSSIAGYDVDNTTYITNFSANFTHESWGWGLQHTNTRVDDHSQTVTVNGFTIYEPVSDSRNELSVLSFNFTPDQHTSFSPLLQWNKLDETDDNNVYRNFSLGFDSNFALIPNEWLLAMGYSYNHDRSNFSDANITNSEYKGEAANFQLTWKALASSNNNPALDAFLKGSYGKNDNISDEDVTRTWQVLMGFDLYWDN